MMVTEEESVLELQLEEDEEEDEEEEEDEGEDDGETYFRTEHVSRTEELQEEVDLAGKEVSILCELLGVTESSTIKRSLPERIADLKNAVSALLDSSRIHFAKANGDVEDIQIVHSKTNGHLVDILDLTKVEELEVKLNETSNKLEECQGELAECEVKMKNQEKEVERLASLLDVTTTKLSAAEEEKKLMSEDLERKYENEDEQIRRDMNIRNEAVKEKNMAWIELSQTKEGRAAADQPPADGGDSTKGGVGSAVGKMATRFTTAGGSESARKHDLLFQVSAVETFWSSGMVLIPVLLYWILFID